MIDWIKNAIHANFRKYCYNIKKRIRPIFTISIVSILALGCIPTRHTYLHVVEPGEKPVKFWKTYTKYELSQLINWKDVKYVKCIIPKSDSCIIWKYSWADFGGSDTIVISDASQFNNFFLTNKDYKIIINDGSPFNTTKEYFHWREICR